MCELCRHGVECRRDRLSVGLGGPILSERRGRRRRRVCTGKWVLFGVVGLGRLEWLTCPPEKPTATTPSSLPAERNFGAIVEGEVMLRAYSRVFN